MTTTIPDNEQRASTFAQHGNDDMGDEPSSRLTPPIQDAGRGTAEKAILSQYHDACERVTDAEQLIAATQRKLRNLRTERSRLHRLAVVIDPSLITRKPKRDAS